MDDRTYGRILAEWALEGLEKALGGDLYPDEPSEKIWGVVAGTELGKKVYGSWQALYKLDWEREEILNAMTDNVLPTYFKRKVENHATPSEEDAAASTYVGNIGALRDIGFENIPWDHVLLARFAGDVQPTEAEPN